MTKQKKGLFGRALFTLILIVIMTACSSEGNGDKSEESTNSGDDNINQGGELTLAYEVDISNYDFVIGNSGTDHVLLWPVFDTLIKFSPELEPLPGLAESWDFPDDNTMILQLREGVTFHDGTVFDAEAAKFNLDRVNSEESTISDLETIESVEVVDEYTIELHLSEADSSLLLALSDRGGMIASPTAIKESGDDFSQNPVGAGPYKMVNHVPNGEIEFEAYEEYWQEGKPLLDKMTVKLIADENARINALKSGEVDYISNISPNNISSLENDNSLVLEESSSVAFRMIYLNGEMEPFDNKEVRLALQHGINREELIEAVNFGYGESADQIFPKEYWAADDEMEIEYDPEKAKQLLEDAEIEDLSFSMYHASNALEQRLADAIKSQLSEIGMEVNMEPMELTAASGSYFEEKKAPAYLSQWTGRPDPQMTINSLFSEDSFYNTGSTSNSEIESLIDEAQSNYEQTERAELYKKISEKAILEEAIMIPIFFFPRVNAMNERVKGIEPNLLGKSTFSDLGIK